MIAFRVPIRHGICFNGFIKKIDNRKAGQILLKISYTLPLHVLSSSKIVIYLPVAC